MTRCIAKTYSTGKRCANSVCEGKLYCYAHKAEEKKRCKATTKAGTRCTRIPGEGLYGLCSIHHEKKSAPKTKEPKASPKVIQKTAKFDHLLTAKLTSDKDWSLIRRHLKAHISGYVLVYAGVDEIDVSFYSDLDDYQFLELFTQKCEEEPKLYDAELFHDTIGEQHAD